MDGRRRQPHIGDELVLQAESLVCSLSGVVRAHIAGGPRGIDAIHVIAQDDVAARGMAGHVRSALLAGLATPVVPARIHVRVQGDLPAPDEVDRSAETPAPDAAGTAHNGYQDIHRIRLLHEEPPPDPEPPNPGAPARTAESAPKNRLAPVRAEPDAPHRLFGPVDRPRLVAVDVHRPDDGRVVCRVSVAWNARVHRAEAIAVDLPGAAAQAAAQAAVRALADAGLQGLELNGLREVEIAGRQYVVVALRRPDHASTRHRSGSAPIIGTPERSAAEAAVDAAAQLI